MPVSPAPAAGSVVSRLRGGRTRGLPADVSLPRAAFIARGTCRAWSTVSRAIDPGLTFPDFSGRPRHILESRAPITELT